jgi:hypothetical protein
VVVGFGPVYTVELSDWIGLGARRFRDMFLVGISVSF